MYFCMTFAKTVSQSGVFNPFKNLVGKLKLRYCVTFDDYTGELFEHPVIENYKIIKFPAKVLSIIISLFIINMKDRKKLSMPVIHSYAAGIDAGSRSHFVAVGQDIDDVREFGVYDKDLRDCALWLKLCGIETVAMESTGSYWQNLYDVLIESGFDVLLVNGAHTKHMKGRKTDVQDCQWIQYLHSVGLLTGSFLPDYDTEELRTLYRHRDFLRKQAAKYINKMQKSLRLMNFRLDIVLNDIE